MNRFGLKIIIALLTTLSACDQGGDRAPSGDSEQPGSFTREQFSRLVWLEGDWRGTLPDGKPFFERYRVTSDSTIQMHGFPDSTMSTPSDSSRIYWRDDHIYSESGTSRYFVTSIDSSGVRFIPERGNNEFTWKQAAEGWTATLRWTDASGEARNVVYEMRRIR